jgi:hypothetical protein
VELRGKISAITAKPPKVETDEPVAVLTLTVEAIVTPDVVGDAAGYFGKTVVVDVDLLQKELPKASAAKLEKEMQELFR